MVKGAIMYLSQKTSGKSFALDCFSETSICPHAQFLLTVSVGPTLPTTSDLLKGSSWSSHRIKAENLLGISSVAKQRRTNSNSAVPWTLRWAIEHLGSLTILRISLCWRSRPSLPSSSWDDLVFSLKQNYPILFKIECIKINRDYFSNRDCSVISDTLRLKHKHYG